MALGPVGQIHISVTDVDRSVAFYRDVLGIPFLFQVPGQPMAFFQSGDVRLYLGHPESPDFHSNALLYFTVDDIDAEYARLSSAGVPMPDPPHLIHKTPDLQIWMTFCTDSGCQHLRLMQHLTPAPTPS